MAKVAKGWVLTSRPTSGPLNEDYFDFKEFELPAVEDGGFLVKILMVSLDPTHRIWATDAPQYMPPQPLGQPMRAGAIGLVEESKNDKFPVGSHVQCFASWSSHHVISKEAAAMASVLPEGDIAVHMALFSFIGLTAYYGYTILDPQPGKTFVVDGAAGAVGSLILQMMKHQGNCKVIGIAGTDEKIEWIKTLGADHGINYRSENVGEKLKEYAPEGIDYVFENVGGDIFAEILKNMNNFGKVALCGLISQYCNDGDGVSQNQFQMTLMRRLQITGFICTDFYTQHVDKIGQYTQDMANWHEAGQLQFKVDIQEGLENVVKVYDRLRTGQNTGKLVVRL